MDLVSSTLDKYLKHRFNGIGSDRNLIDNGLAKATSDDIPVIVPTPTISKNNINNNNNNSNNIVDSMSFMNATAKESTTQLLGEVLPPGIQINNHQLDSERTRLSIEQQIIENGTDEMDCKLPTIYNISIRNIKPCCVALRCDLRYFAAGFENSHIYLWNFDGDSTQMSIGEMYTLIAHSGSVYSIEFINNNDLMLSCSEDTTIRLWCLNTKCNVLVFRGHNYPIWSLDVSSQARFFASASMDATARLWCLDRITPLRIFCGHHDDVECVKFHPNEKYIATGSADSTVRLWSVLDGKMVRLMVGHEDPIISLSFLPNGKFLASASRGGAIKVWNLATNSISSELAVPASLTISFSPEQKFVSSCGVDNILRLWQVDGISCLKEKKRVDSQVQASNLIQSQFFRDNKLFVSSYTPSTKMDK